MPWTLTLIQSAAEPPRGGHPHTPLHTHTTSPSQLFHQQLLINLNEAMQRCCDRRSEKEEREEYCILLRAGEKEGSVKRGQVRADSCAEWGEQLLRLLPPEKTPIHSPSSAARNPQIPSSLPLIT